MFKEVNITVPFQSMRAYLTLLVVFFLLHCSNVGQTDPTALELDRKRGCMIIEEINWVGSLRNDGSYDADDDFLEMRNRTCNKAVDLTGWELIMEGEFNRIYIIPSGPNNIIQPNQLAVLINKRDGAFRENGTYKPIVVPGMIFPHRSFTIETRTAENFLMENAVNNLEGEPLAGGYDGYTIRSMERTEDTFDEEGSRFASWHSSTPCNEEYASSDMLLFGTGCGMADSPLGRTGINIYQDYTQRTFATPGEKNTLNYE